MAPSANPAREQLEHKPMALRERSVALALLTLGSVALARAESTACPAGPGPKANAVTANYAQAIHFDVYRNDQLVGRHDTRFAAEDGALVVRSTLELSIKVLFIEAYHYRYDAIEHWCDDHLVKLDATVDDGGKLSEVHATPKDDALLLTAVDGNSRAPAGSFSTNHWHPGVLDTSVVINTLTGHLNRVQLVACTASTPNGEAGNRCVDYTGDLQARVWYDPDGRWRGLAFAGSDGSAIDYRLVAARTGEQAARADP